jgi:hypothetical protein
MIAGHPLRSVKEIVTDDGRHRNLDPLLGRTEPGEQAFPTGRRRQKLVAVIKCASLVRWIFQHLAEAGD